MRALTFLFALSLTGCPALLGTFEDCSVDITNGTSGSIWFLHIRDAGGDDWGADVLDDQRLEDGETHTATLAPGSYDVQAEWPSPGSETFTRLDAITCVDGEEQGITLSLSDQD